MKENFNKAKIDYLLCNILYKLSSVLDIFPNEKLKKEINKTLLLIESKCLNVAIVGEFRRGKSSLINALLGMPVLPVDIEPTTAAINRVTFGLKPKATVHFKDGNSLEVPIQELSDYVTKLTPSASMVAETVKEAVVQYPTELCGNNIDIIDTPGLNDTESMTAVTENLLNDVNVAVVAIKSTMPYSETECYWVTKLLSLPKLNHIVFVLTCMDLVTSSDVQKVLSYTRKRICEKTLESVRTVYSHRPEFVKKAERLFSEDNFVLYPVSAALALDSFDNGDYELLVKSNIPALKKDLMTTFNSQQQLLAVYETERLIDSFKSWIYSFTEDDYIYAFSQQLNELANAETAVETYLQKRSDMIKNTINKIDSEINQQISVHLSKEKIENSIRKSFIKYLSEITDNTKNSICTAIRSTEDEVSIYLSNVLEDDFIKAVNATILRNLNAFLCDRNDKLSFDNRKLLMEECGIPSFADLKALVVKQLKNGLKIDLPKFSVSIPRLIINHNIMQSLINPYINTFAKKYRNAWTKALPEYTQKWCSTILHAEPLDLFNRFQNTVYIHKGAVNEKISYMRVQHEKAESLIEEEHGKLKEFMEELLA